MFTEKNITIITKTKHFCGSGYGVTREKNNGERKYCFVYDMIKRKDV